MHAAALSILSLLVLFLIILFFGSPIMAFGNKTLSVVYAVTVFVPVAIVCVYALIRRT